MDESIGVCILAHPKETYKIAAVSLVYTGTKSTTGEAIYALRRPTHTHTQQTHNWTVRNVAVGTQRWPPPYEELQSAPMRRRGKNEIIVIYGLGICVFYARAYERVFSMSHPFPIQFVSEHRACVRLHLCICASVCVIEVRSNLYNHNGFAVAPGARRTLKQ